MKTSLRLASFVSLAAALALLAACSKPVEPAPAADQTPAPAESAPTTPSVAGIPAAAIAKAENVVAKVEAASAGATEIFNETIAKTKTLLADKRLPEALKALDALQDVVLSPAQQKTVDDLRAQITQAMNAAKQIDGVKNLLGK